MESPVWLDSHPDEDDAVCVPVFVHASHDMGPKLGTSGEECFRCMLCTCHSAHELTLKCGEQAPETDEPHPVKSKSRIVDIRQLGL